MKPTFFLSLFFLLNTFCSAQNTIGQSKIKNTFIFPDEWRGKISFGKQATNADLWFASNQGVYRYDGKLFYNYTSMDGLNTTAINDIFEDKNGNLWFAAVGGVSKFDGKKITCIVLPNADGTPYNNPFTFLGLQNNFSNNSGSWKNYVANITQDKSGIYWVGGIGVYRYDGKKLTRFLSYECRDVLAGSKYGGEDFGVCNTFADSKGNIWFRITRCGTDCYLYRMDVSRTNFPCINNTCQHDLKNPNDLTEHKKEIEKSFVKIEMKDNKKWFDVTTIFEDKKGNLWFGTYDSGVYQFDGKSLVSFSAKDGLNKNFVKSIMEDKKGNIWFGTVGTNDDGYKGNGAFCFDGSSLKHFTTMNGLPENSITNITGDNAGNIWLATEMFGVSCFDGKSFKNYSEKDGLLSNKSLSIIKDKTGNLWFGSEQMGLSKFDGKSFVSFTETRKK